MEIGLSDIADLLCKKLIEAGYKIDMNNENLQDEMKALQQCVILPKGNKVQVVMGLYGGCLDEVVVRRDEGSAKRTVKRLDKQLGIERDEDGNYEHDENDVWWREAKVK